ncbi:unnamed protein product [Enterobius vermicularis]|uniref:Uncharacterized protein n=1 Tax=Enterobius vermicularis TaxID=51028 RepID=A0A0N4VGB8_ENTVE|nr:unnamed protein product [Enterobius vermicularis]
MCACPRSSMCKKRLVRFRVEALSAVIYGDRLQGVCHPQSSVRKPIGVLWVIFSFAAASSGASLTDFQQSLLSPHASRRSPSSP